MAKSRPRKREPHPLVRSFLAKKLPFLKILKEVTPPTQIARAMVALTECRRGKRELGEAIAEAGKVNWTEEPADLLIIFFCLWAAVDRNNDRLSEAMTLLKRAQGLVSDETPVELRAFLLHNEANNASFAGDQESSVRLYEQAVALVPQGLLMRDDIILNRAFMLAILGRGVEAEAEVEELQSRRGVGRDDGSNYAMLRLINCAETGRVEEALAALPEIAEDSPIARMQAHDLKYCKALLNLMQGLPVEQPPHWAEVISALLAGRPAEALEHARLQAREETGFMYDPYFHSFNMVRAELATGQGEAARRLIRLRQERGNVHFIDDFFLARAELLRGNQPAAAERFAAALASCERYGAEGRLEFEIKLSCELTPVDAMRLARARPARVPAAAAGLGKPKPTDADGPRGRGRLIGESRAMTAIRGAVLRFAALDIPLLITGETGTGKDIVSRAIHEEGPRRDEPFVAVNCGALAEGLLQSELFGHERGAFTGALKTHKGLLETAGQGSVFLDEIGDISPGLQVALLRVLESGEIRPVGSSKARKFKCRIIAATNARLDQRAEEGRFRKDLLYRLKRLELVIPPLRERPEDVLPLAGHFFSASRTDGARPVMSDALRKALSEYTWPGNVRELRNEVERMRLMNSDKLAYDLEDLAPQLRDLAAAGSETTPRRGSSAREAGALADAAAPLELKRGSSPMRRLEVLQELFRRHRKLTRLEVARTMAISPNTATKYLKLLVEQGLVDKVEPTPSPRTHFFQLRD